jgi:twitching motility protein PilT
MLVTGGAATGKSTTLAAMIDHMNRNFAHHIITLEDPIEYTFRHDKSIIEQREIGIDSVSFPSALRHVVRQRPDVILIGEMRDLETISTALSAAEMGHLVLATLHTTSAMQSVQRIIDVFPAAQQGQVRVQLSTALQAVVCQMLFHDRQSGGLAPAVEIMVCTPAMRRAIRDNETHLLAGMIETGQSLGMQTMDSAISHLVSQQRISREDAVASAHDVEKMRRLLAAA